MRKICILIILSVASLSMQAQDYYVTDFGAIPDGITLCTHSIQAAIDTAHAHGGGRVILPSGQYVSGSLYLKSNVTLYLAPDAILLGSLNPFDYIKDPYCHWTALIFAIKQQNIAIKGNGTIDCRGWQVANNMVNYIHMGLVEDPLKYDRPNETNRPENIHFRECKDITISNITLKNPASWNQQYDQCSQLLIENINVDAKCYWNNDGLDVVDCQDVIIRNCYIDAADDAYCFKSHSANGISKNIVVENCTGRSSANGIKFGTMTRGQFKHFRFKNIKIFDTYRSAFTIASVDGASIEDIEIDGLQSLHTGNPIFLRFASRNKGIVTPCLKDIVIKNVYATVPYNKADAGYSYEGPVEDLPRNISPSSIVGTPGHRIQNVRLENIEIVYPGRADSTYAYCGTSASELNAIPEHEKRYPEFSMFKELPAWGFYIRHADDIIMNNVVLRVEGADYRPAIVADDVQRLTLGVDIHQSNSQGKDQIVVSKATVASRIPATSNTTSTDSKQTKQYRASKFGIKSDGITDNTNSLQHAIDYIAAQGGGELLIEVGRYLTGSLHLHNQVNIILNEGAILVASKNPYDYNRINGNPILLLADNEKKSQIMGLGMIELPHTVTLCNNNNAIQVSTLPR